MSLFLIFIKIISNVVNTNIHPYGTIGWTIIFLLLYEQELVRCHLVPMGSFTSTTRIPSWQRMADKSLVSMPSGSLYCRVKLLEIKPCSSILVPCWALISSQPSKVWMMISSGRNWTTSSRIWKRYLPSRVGNCASESTGGTWAALAFLRSTVVGPGNAYKAWSSLQSSKPRASNSSS